MPPFQYQTINNKAAKEELKARMARFEQEHQGNTQNLKLYKQLGDDTMTAAQAAEAAGDQEAADKLYIKAEEYYVQARQAKENVENNERSILATRAEYQAIKNDADAGVVVPIDPESIVVPPPPEPVPEPDEDEFDEQPVNDEPKTVDA